MKNLFLILFLLFGMTAIAYGERCETVTDSGEGSACKMVQKCSENTMISCSVSVPERTSSTDGLAPSGGIVICSKCSGRQSKGYITCNAYDSYDKLVEGGEKIACSTETETSHAE